MIADGNGDFSKALGLTFDGSAYGMGCAASVFDAGQGRQGGRAQRRTAGRLWRVVGRTSAGAAGLSHAAVRPARRPHPPQPADRGGGRGGPGHRLGGVAACSRALNWTAGAGETLINAYLKIGADGRVVVAVAQAEMGQGIWSALAQIIADELGADWRPWAWSRRRWAPIMPIPAWRMGAAADHPNRCAA
jgi:hypothetical protein